MTTEKCLIKKCEKSPDGTHCWHQSGLPEVLIPGGTNQINEFCCWCGDTRSYEIQITTSFTVTTMEHGPHYRETYIQ